MSQISINVPPEIEEELQRYLRFECNKEDLSPHAKEALDAYTAQQRSEATLVNTDRPYRTLRFPPSNVGSGLSDVSINHDKYLAEDFMRERSEK